MTYDKLVELAGLCSCIADNDEPASWRRPASPSVFFTVTPRTPSIFATCSVRTPGGKVKLDEVSKLLGLTGKPEGIDGSRVEEMVLAGQIEEVARYCESDVLNTYRVWLIYELFRGAITAEQLAWSEGQIREFVANQSAPVCGSGHCGSPG